MSCDELAGALGRTLVDPLRRRIERSFDDADGDLEEVTERLRALYREWKGQHIGRAVRHYTPAAYSLGGTDAVAKGEPQRWLVDASCEACPDCDDNALAGEIAARRRLPDGRHPAARPPGLPLPRRGGRPASTRADDHASSASSGGAAWRPRARG